MSWFDKIIGNKQDVSGVSKAGSAEKSNKSQSSNDAQAGTIYDNVSYNQGAKSIESSEQDYLDAAAKFNKSSTPASSSSKQANTSSNANTANSASRMSNSRRTPSINSGTAGSGSTVSAANISGNESSSQLRSSRSDALSQLSEAQAQKTNNDAVNQAKSQVEQDKQAYDDAVEQLSSDDEQIQSQIDDIKSRKSDIDSAKSDQQSQISDINSNISSKNSEISDLNSQLSGLVQPSQSDYMTTDEKGNSKPDSAAYNAAMAEYEAQKAAIEEQIASAENELTNLQSQLTDAESQLNDLEQQASEVDQELSELLSSDDGQKIQNQQAVQDAMSNYQDSQQNLSQTEQQETAQIDANISQLQDNISAYDDAIQTKEQEEAQEAQQAQQQNDQESDSADPLSAANTDAQTASIQDTASTDDKESDDDQEKDKDEQCDKTDPVEIKLDGQNYTLVTESGEEFDSVADFLGANGSDEITSLDDNEDGVVTFSELEKGGVSLVDSDSKEESQISDIIDESDLDSKGISVEHIDTDKYDDGKNQKVVFVDKDGEKITDITLKGNDDTSSISGRITFENTQELAAEYNIKDADGGYVQESTEDEAKKIIDDNNYTQQDSGTITNADGDTVGHAVENRDGSISYYFDTDEKPKTTNDTTGSDKSDDSSTDDGEDIKFDLDKYYKENKANGLDYENNEVVRGAMRTELLEALGYNSKQIDNITEEKLSDVYNDILNKNSDLKEKLKDSATDDLKQSAPADFNTLVEKAMLELSHDGVTGNDQITIGKSSSKTGKSDSSLDVDKYYQANKANGLNYEENEDVRKELKTDILKTAGYSDNQIEKMSDKEVANVYEKVLEKNADNASLKSKIGDTDLAALKESDVSEYNTFVEKAILAVSHDGIRDNDSIKIAASGDSFGAGKSAKFTDEFETDAAQEYADKLNGESKSGAKVSPEDIDYKGIMSDIVNDDDLTSSDKIKLVETLKEKAESDDLTDDTAQNVQDALDSIDESVYTDYIKDYAKNASTEDFLQAESRIKDLLGSDDNGQIAFQNKDSLKAYTNAVIEAYKNASSEDAVTLNEELNITQAVKAAYSGDEAAEKITEMLESRIGKDNNYEDFLVETDLYEDDIENDFGSPSAENAQKFVDKMLNGDLDDCDTNYLKASLLYLSGGSYDSVAETFGINDNNGSNQVMSAVMNLFGDKIGTDITDEVSTKSSKKSEKTDEKITLESDEIEELAEKLTDTTNETAWSELDLSQYSSSTINKLIEAYEGNDEKAISATFADRLEQSTKMDNANATTVSNNMKAVAEAYLSGEADKLSEYVESALNKAENGNLGRLNILMNAAADRYPTEMRNCIEAYNEENTSATFEERLNEISKTYQKSYDENLEAIKTTETISEDEMNKINGLNANEDETEWADLIKSDSDEVAKLEKSYDKVFGEGAFERDAQNILGASDYEKKIAEINTADKAESKLSDDDIAALVQATDSNKLKYGDFSDSDLAKLKEAYDGINGNGAFDGMVLASKEFGNETSKYSAFEANIAQGREILANEENDDKTTTKEKSVTAELSDTFSSDSAKNYNNMLMGISVTGIVQDADKIDFSQIMQAAMKDSDVNSSDKLLLMDTLKIISNSENIKADNADAIAQKAQEALNQTETIPILEDFAKNGSVDDLLNAYDKILDIKDSQSKTLITTDKETNDNYLDALMSAYQNASPDEKLAMNEKLNTAKVIQKAYSDSDETEKLSEFLNTLSGGNDYSDFLGETGFSENEIETDFGTPAIENTKSILERLQSSDLDSCDANYIKASLLYTAGGDGTCADLINTLRSKDDSGSFNFSTAEQELYVPIIMDLFASDSETISDFKEKSPDTFAETTAQESTLKESDFAYIDEILGSGVETELEDLFNKNTFDYDGADNKDTPALNVLTEKLNEIFAGDEYSNNEKIEFLAHISEQSDESSSSQNTLKGFVEGYIENYFGMSLTGEFKHDFNQFFKESCSKADANGDLQLNAQNAISFANSMAKIFKNSDMSISDLIDSKEDYANTIVNLYENASPAEITKLNDLLNTGSIIQEAFSKNEETQILTGLLEKISNTCGTVDENGSIKASSNDGVSEAILAQRYSNIGSILEALQNGDIEKSQASYCLSKLSDSTVSGIVSEFRNLSASEQEEYVSTLFNLLGEKEPE